MVWIYGGGFLVGGSMGANFLDNYLYSGQEIADRGDVIVVTIGYRVGALGYLSTGDSSLPGRSLRDTNSPSFRNLEDFMMNLIGC